MMILFRLGYIKLEVIVMFYKVHKFHVGKSIDEKALERFLNDISGEVISVFPNVVPKFQFMGAAAGFDTLIIIEKTI